MALSGLFAVASSCAEEDQEIQIQPCKIDRGPNRGLDRENMKETWKQIKKLKLKVKLLKLSRFD